jgi:hypothetical protein
MHQQMLQAWAQISGEISWVALEHIDELIRTASHETLSLLQGCFFMLEAVFFVFVGAPVGKCSFDVAQTTKNHITAWVEKCQQSNLPCYTSKLSCYDCSYVHLPCTYFDFRGVHLRLRVTFFQQSDFPVMFFSPPDNGHVHSARSFWSST